MDAISADISEPSTILYRVDREIKFPKNVDQSVLTNLTEILGSQLGIIGFSPTSQHNKYFLSYNLYQIEIEEIFDLIDDQIDLDKVGIWSKIKYGYWKFSDSNQKDILKSSVNCCNKSPV